MFGETVIDESVKKELIVSLNVGLSDQINSLELPSELAVIFIEPPPSHKIVSLGKLTKGVLIWMVWKAVSMHIPLDMNNE